MKNIQCAEVVNGKRCETQREQGNAYCTKHRKKITRNADGLIIPAVIG